MEATINNIVGNVRAMSADVEDTRTVTFIASTSSVDRHGTVLNQDNWNLKNFNSNPIIGYQHNVYGGDMCNAPNPDDQLGSARAYFETVKRDGNDEKQLMVDITFEPGDINPLAEKIFRKVLHGTLRAVSVGFVPQTDKHGRQGEERDGAFHYFGQELLEVSVVNIPSNPDALKRSMRDSGANAVLFLTKTLGKSFSEIEGMTVRDVLDNLGDKPVVKSIEPEVKPVEEKEEEIKELKETCKNQEKELLLLKLKGNN